MNTITVNPTSADVRRLRARCGVLASLVRVNLQGYRYTRSRWQRICLRALLIELRMSRASLRCALETDRLAQLARELPEVMP